MKSRTSRLIKYVNEELGFDSIARMAPTIKDQDQIIQLYKKTHPEIKKIDNLDLFEWAIRKQILILLTDDELAAL